MRMTFSQMVTHILDGGTVSPERVQVDALDAELMRDEGEGTVPRLFLCQPKSRRATFVTEARRVLVEGSPRDKSGMRSRLQAMGYTFTAKLFTR